MDFLIKNNYHRPINCSATRNTKFTFLLRGGDSEFKTANEVSVIVIPNSSKPSVSSPHYEDALWSANIEGKCFSSMCDEKSN